FIRLASSNVSARIVLEYRNSDNTIALASYDTGPVTDQSKWTIFTDSRTAPAGTAWIRVRLIATNNFSFTLGNYGYFDGITVRAITASQVRLSGTAADDGLP